MKVKNKQELIQEIERAINEYGDEVYLNYINTSQITDMSYLFYGLKKFNGKIENWDTSKVITMYEMFCGAESFNQPLNFDTSKVTDMHGMFEWAKKFNQPLNFDTTKVINMGYMFSEATNFNQELDWKISQGTNMYNMFQGSKGKLITKKK